MGLESRHLPDNLDGVVGPATVNLATQDEQTGLGRSVDVSISAPFGRDGVLQGSPVMSGSRHPGIACACVHTDNRDITEERDPSTRADGEGTWSRDDVHAAPVRGARN